MYCTCTSRSTTAVVAVAIPRVPTCMYLARHRYACPGTGGNFVAHIHSDFRSFTESVQCANEKIKPCEFLPNIRLKIT